MPDATLAFTPEAVRDTLLTAGFTEYNDKQSIDGFQIGDGRETRSEICVSYHPAGRDFGSLEAWWEFVSLRDGAHRDALAAAGYRVSIEDRYVVIRDTP